MIYFLIHYSIKEQLEWFSHLEDDNNSLLNMNVTHILNSSFKKFFTEEACLVHTVVPFLSWRKYQTLPHNDCTTMYSKLSLDIFNHFDIIHSSPSKIPSCCFNLLFSHGSECERFFSCIFWYYYFDIVFTYFFINICSDSCQIPQLYHFWFCWMFLTITFTDWLLE